MKPRISIAFEVADILWPKFEDRDGVIVLAGTQHFDPSRHGSKSDAEAAYSHTHMIDCFAHDWGYVTDPELDVKSPDPEDPEHVLSWSVAKQKR